jgi:hypothetical protein
MSPIGPSNGDVRYSDSCLQFCNGIDHRAVPVPGDAPEGAYYISDVENPSKALI